MRKKVLRSLFIIGCLAAVISIAGCAMLQIAVPTEFSGTWQGSGSESFTFTSLKITSTGSALGSAEYKVTSYDETANHIYTTFVSGSGIFLLIPAGTAYYWTYSISGNQMYYDNSTSTYPSSTPNGPLTRQ